MAVVIVRVRIVKPRNKADLEDDEKLKDIFNDKIGIRPYCYEFQGVVKGAPGSANRKNVPIKGEIEPAGAGLDFEWKWDASIGKLKNTETLAPKHVPPINAGTGTVTLRLKDYPNIKDSKTIRIFKDHLARDVANFKSGKSCTPIELSDGSEVDGVNLTCGPAMVHAHQGTVNPPAPALWRQLKAKGWTEVRYDNWDDFKTAKLDRGWKVYLKMNLYGEEIGLHYQTCKTLGSGKTAVTYAGDSESHVFRHETVDSYYRYRKIAIEDRVVLILKH